MITITKKGTEKVIQETDNLVKACCEKVGAFSYEGQMITEKWAQLRRGLARVAANTLVGAYSDKNGGNKMTVTGYAPPSSVESSPGIKTKAIELSKSQDAKTPVVSEEKFIIRIDK